LITTPAEMVRDPYVFEFLGLKREELYTESKLERALVDHLQEFLLEMGRGFCFVARQRRGAMNFYLNYLKAEEMEAGENPPIGILLCSAKNETHVEYALGGMSNQIFVSRYLPHVPTKEELEAFLRQTRHRLEA